MNLFLVAIGGAAGSLLRYGVGIAAARLFGAGFPYGTLAVNVAGSFLMGAAVELIARRYGGSPELRLFVMTGFLGGFTTFSAFSLDVLVLWERGAQGLAIGYMLASVALGIGGLLAGLAIIRATM